MYDKVPTSMNFVEREKKVEKFWEENHIFEKSIDNRKKGETRKLLISLFVPTRSPGQIFSIKKPPWNYEIKFLIRQHFKALDLCAIL